MILAIDVGNTNIVVGCRQPLLSWRLSTHPIRTADEFRAELRALLEAEGISFKKLEAVVVSSVVPQATAMIRASFSRSAASLHVIDHSWPFSFTIKTKNPEQIGADRLVNAEAVMREFGAPAIIVDSGTATTLCAVSAKKEYWGGAIMPGIELSIETLARRAAKLFTIELTPPSRAIGETTDEALRSGILFGYASMIDGMVRRFKQELGEPSARVIATGGVSTLLKGISSELTDLDPDLTLKGIFHLYESIRAR